MDVVLLRQSSALVMHRIMIFTCIVADMSDGTVENDVVDRADNPRIFFAIPGSRDFKKSNPGIFRDPGIEQFFFINLPTIQDLP